MQKNIKLQKSFLLFIASLLVIGIFFRCYNIDRKVYWHDEVYTSVRTVGYNKPEVVAEFFNGEVIEAQALLKYQVINPERDWRDTLDKLLENPEHPPLYYIFSRFWQQLFNSSILSTRSLSVVFSLLLFPLIYLFCLQLFNSPKVGWWTMGIVAISPVQVLYAQEAREYSLLLVTTILTCIALIGAVKKNNWQWWVFYSVSLAVNFYVSLIAAYLAIAQAVYIIILERFRPTKILINFILAGIFSVILFTPWLLVIYQNFQTFQNKTRWSTMSRPFVELLRAWELHLSSIFIDFHPSVSGYISVRIFGFLAIFIFLCYKYLCDRNQRRSWLLIVTMAFIPIGMLILPDMINGGIKSVMTRYFLPSLLMIQIAVAHWISEIENRQYIQRNIAVFLIISLGIISCTISLKADTWWNKVVGYHNQRIATIVSEYPQPLIISDSHDINVGNIISLAYYLKDNTKLLLFTNRNVPLVDIEGSQDILLWNLEEESLVKFQEQNNCQLEKVEGSYYPPLLLVKTLDSNS